MTEVREHVTAEIENRDETLTPEEFVRIVEAHHETRGRGIDWATLEAYAEAVRFDVDLDQFRERTIDSDSWEAGDHFYSFGDDRVSVYPPDWHETIAGTEDIREVIRVIQAETTEAEGDERGAVTDRGVPEQKVLHVAETVAGIDRQAAREQIKQLRQNGEIEEFASQNRNPTIRLA